MVNHTRLASAACHARKSIISRYNMVHDGRTPYQSTKNKKPSNNMLPFEKMVVRVMPNDIHRRNKLEPAPQFGLLAGLVPRTG